MEGKRIPEEDTLGSRFAIRGRRTLKQTSDADRGDEMVVRFKEGAQLLGEVEKCLHAGACTLPSSPLAFARFGLLAACRSLAPLLLFEKKKHVTSSLSGRRLLLKLTVSFRLSYSSIVTI